MERRDLVERESVDGTLGYGETRPVSSPRSGTLTGAPAPGATIERGQSAMEVDGRGVPVLYGARPMWRVLASGVDDGPDVQQLEENLAALGHAPEGMTVDDHWDARTTTAVKRWQDALGLEETGTVAPGDLVFLPGPVRVASVEAEVGDAAQPGAAVLQVTGTEKLVSVDLDASRRALAVAGESVQVELPGGELVEGVIRDVGAVATVQNSEQGNTTPTIEVTVTLTDPSAGAGLESTPVDVHLTRAAAEGVLAVLVRALLALAEGGYAVEVVGEATTRLVAVETGAFADGWVEVRGEIEEGDEVVVPE